MPHVPCSALLLAPLLHPHLCGSVLLPRYNSRVPPCRGLDLTPSAPLLRPLPLETTHTRPLPRQHLMPEFEEMNCDVVAVSADTRGKACSFVSSDVPAARPAAGSRAGCMLGGGASTGGVGRQCGALCSPAPTPMLFYRCTHLLAQLPLPACHRWTTCAARCWPSAPTPARGASDSRHGRLSCSPAWLPVLSRAWLVVLLPSCCRLAVS